ncbi:hypothetical protein N7470_008821 [Penicillium chermesinum]|nr:hypothetical protein N7470_008821 [Penicillium chermesinum]
MIKNIHFANISVIPLVAYSGHLENSTDNNCKIEFVSENHSHDDAPEVVCTESSELPCQLEAKLANLA